MKQHMNFLRSLVSASRLPRTCLRSRCAVLLAAVLSCCMMGAQAQTAHFAGYQTFVLGTFFGDHFSGVGLDASGNLYVCDTTNDQVLKLPVLGSGFGTSVVIASNLPSPSYVAVAPDGEVYVSTTSGVFDLVPSGQSYSSFLVTPTLYTAMAGIATDSSGNLYAADTTDQELLELVPSGQAGSSRSYQKFVLATGIKNLAGVAFYNNYLFVTNGTVLYRYLVQNHSVGLVYTFGSTFSALSDVAVSKTGVVYVADPGTGSIYTENQFGNNYLQLYFAQDYGSNLALDSSNNVIVSSYSRQIINKIAPSFPSFPLTQADGGTSPAQTAVFVFDSAGTASFGISTQGITGLDFGSTVLPSGSFAAGTEVDMPITFKPTAAGLRTGAVEILNSSGTVLAAQYLQGIGSGPQAALYPGVQSSLQAGGSFHPQAMAVDPAGNVYICDPANNAVSKKSLVNGSYVSTSIGSSLSSPSGIALDGAGNVYISDTGNGRVLKETLSGGSYTQSVFASITTPLGLAVSGNGVLYIADGSSGIKSETIYPYSYTPVAISSGASAPNGVAVDSSGNIYISDLGNKRILKETLNGSSTYTESTVFTGFTPSGVTLDGAGNVYVTDYDNGLIAIAMPNGTSYTYFNGVTGLSTPGGLAVDETGNLYIGDSGNQRVLKVNVEIGAGLIFPDTAVGSSSAPQDITLANVGTLALTLGVPSTGSNPSLPSSFTLDNSTTCGNASIYSFYAFSLQPNSNCIYAVDFSPTAAGAEGGPLTLTDNSTINSANQQSVYLGGNGILASKTITFPQPGSPTAQGSMATLTATASNGDPVVYSITSGTASLSGSSVTFTTLGNVTITANSAATSTTSAAAPVSVSISVVAAQQSVSWLPSTLSIYTGTPLGTGVLDATSNVAANITYISTQLLPSVTTNVVTASTVLSMGHYLLTATVTPTVPGYTAFSSSLPFYVQNMNPFIANTNGSMSSVYNNGNAQSSSTTGGGIGAAVDSSGYVWSLSANGTSAVKYTDAGAVSATYSNVGLVAASALAVDGFGQVWIANGNNTLTALSNAGSVLWTTSNANFSAPSGVAIDMSGNVWITSSGNNTVEEVIGGAAPVAPLTNAVQNLSPAIRP